MGVLLLLGAVGVLAPTSVARGAPERATVRVAPVSPPTALASSAVPPGGMWTQAFRWPTARNWPAFAYDAKIDRGVAFGGLENYNADADTWTYDYGSNLWIEQTPAVHPAGRYMASMVYDSRADRMILFGGYGNNYAVFNDTWAYDYGNDTWVDMRPIAAPPIVTQPGMVYDSRSDKVILYGGAGPSSLGPYSNQTWTYDLGTNTWRNVSPLTSPQGRSDFGIAYDSRADRVIIYGGTVSCSLVIVPNPDCYNGETWAFDLVNGTWTPKAFGPDPLQGVSLGYDAAVSRVILFGGDNPSTLTYYYTQTWTYNVFTNTWTNANPPPHPPPNDGYGMTYDSASRRDLIYPSQIFAYDAVNNTWTVPPIPPSPPCCSDARMAYDRAADRMVFYGGYGGSTGIGGLTWSYDYATRSWQNLAPAVSPIPRESVGLAYDSKADRTILFGGWVTSWGTPTGETWAYDYANNTWVNRTAAGGPSPRGNSVMVYAPELDRTILFGGTTGASATKPTNQTWVYDYANNTWTNVTPAVSPQVAAYGMVYNTRWHRALLFGGPGYFVPGQPSATWAYDPRNNTWTNVTPGYGPDVRSWPGMAYDSKVDKALLFGGDRGVVCGSSCIDYQSNETWAFDFANDTWTDLVPVTAPYPGTGRPMEYDPVAARTISAWGGGAQMWAYAYAPTVPTAPRSLQIVATTSNVTLVWNPPATDGGSPIIGYRVYRGTASSGESLLATLGDLFTYRDWNVTTNRSYFYEVSALSAVGEGPRSQERVGYTGPTYLLLAVSPAVGRYGYRLVNFTIADNGTETWSIDPGDGSANTTGTYPAGVTALQYYVSYWTQGSFALTLRMVGAWRTISESASILVDAVPPWVQASVAGTISATGWYRQRPTLFLNASDNSSGVRWVSYLLGTTAPSGWKNYTAPVLLSDGAYKVYYEGMDWAGNYVFGSTSRIQVDTSPPNIGALFGGPGGTNGWFVGPAQLTLNVTDTTSGVWSVFVNVDGGGMTNYTSPLNLEDGVHFINVTATDAAGNVARDSIEVRVDSTPPSLSINPIPATVSSGQVTVAWSGSDDLSGIADYQVRVDGGPLVDVGMNARFTVALADGFHTVTVTAVNGAGNMTEASVSFAVDTNPFSPSGPYAGAPTYAIIVAAVALAGIVLWRRRHRLPPEPPAPPASGS